MSRFVRTMPADEQIEFLDALRRFLRLGPWPGSRRACIEADARKVPQRYSDRYAAPSSDGCRQVRKVGTHT